MNCLFTCNVGDEKAQVKQSLVLSNKPFKFFLYKFSTLALILN